MNTDQVKAMQRQIEQLQKSMLLLAGEQEVVQFGDYARSYMGNKVLNPTLRVSTKRSFRHTVTAHLIPAFGQLPITHVTNVLWLEWVMELREKPLAPGERKITRFFNARKALTEILLAAKTDGLIERLPKLDNPDEVRSTGRALEPAEIYRLLKACRKPFFRFFFFTLFKMGCRPREVLRWEWSMIRWGEPGKTWIDIPARISKTDRARSIPINPSVSRRLWKMQGNGSPFVFPNRMDPTRPQLSYHGAWKTMCQRAGVKKAMPYDFRRTFITKRAAEGKPMIYVAKTLDTSTKMIESTYAKAQAQVMEEIVR